MEKPELAVGEVGDELADPGLAAREVEHDPPRREHVLLGGRLPGAKLDADAREQLVERERLGDVVGRAELEPAQLRLEVGAGREDQHRQPGPLAMELTQHLETAQAWQEQIEHDEVETARRRERKPVPAVVGREHAVALSFQPSRKKGLDTGLILDHQDPHRSPIDRASSPRHASRRLDCNSDEDDV